MNHVMALTMLLLLTCAGPAEAKAKPKAKHHHRGIAHILSYPVRHPIKSQDKAGRAIGHAVKKTGQAAAAVAY